MLLQLQQMFQAVIIGDALQLITYNLVHFVLDMVIVFQHLLLAAVVVVFVRKVRNDEDRLVSLRLGCDPRIVHHNISVEDFLLDKLVKVVRYRTEEHSLLQTERVVKPKTKESCSER